MNVEAVRTHQHIPGRQVVPNLVAVDVGLNFVGQQDIDHVGCLGCLGDRHRLEAVSDRQIVVRRSRSLTDHDLATAVSQILGLGVTLRTVTKNRNRLAFEMGQVGVVIVINRGSHESVTFCLIVLSMGFAGQTHAPVEREGWNRG